MGSLSLEQAGSPRFLTPKYCSIVLAPNLPVEPPGAVWERTENVGFCSSVTFSGVRGCVCSPCVTAQGSGSTGPPQGIQLLPEVGNVWELPLLPSASGWALWGAAVDGSPGEKSVPGAPPEGRKLFPNSWNDSHARPAEKELVGRRFCCTFGEVLGYQVLGYPVTLTFAKGLCEVSDAHWVSLQAHSQYLARNFVLILCKCKVPFVKSNSRVWIWHSCTSPR